MTRMKSRTMHSEMHSENPPHTHQLQLPSGADATDAQLHLCPCCEGEFVYPLDWTEEGSKHWKILLRCPDCEWVDTGIFPQAAVERLDAELDRATSALLNDLRCMTHANMVKEVNFFIRALQADLIIPSDF
jgi:hypothetical protein